MALNSFNKALINVYTDYRGKENGGLKKWKGICRNRTTGTRGIFYYYCMQKLSTRLGGIRACGGGT